MKSIIVFADYFGRWPQWFDMYVESCRYNSTVNWCIHTDCTPPVNLPDNIKIIYITFAEYCAKVSDTLGVRFQPVHPYNICDVRPMLGVIHADQIAGYDYFGWSDIDVIYGDIRSIYNDSVLSYNVVSAHGHTCSGHLTLIKNELWLKNAYLHINGWRDRLEDPRLYDWRGGLDEAHLTALFSPTRYVRRSFSEMTGTVSPDPQFYINNYFSEQWSTPFTPGRWIDGRREHPETWYWHNGKVSNSSDEGRSFLYLHLMNFKAPCWVNTDLYGQSMTWKQLETCLTFCVQELRHRPAAQRRVRIDRFGIHLDGGDVQHHV